MISYFNKTKLILAQYVADNWDNNILEIFSYYATNKTWLITNSISKSVSEKTMEEQIMVKVLLFRVNEFTANQTLLLVKTLLNTLYS
jgi:hypothetical protein